MFLNSALIIGLRNHIENTIKTGQQNKEINLHNLPDPKACCEVCVVYNAIGPGTMEEQIVKMILKKGQKFSIRT